MTSSSSTTEKLYFTTLDYVFFCCMLCLSMLIGIYYGFFAKRKQNTTSEYLLGSKTMKIFPVSMSLTATHISAITLLGVPAEMYKFGTQYSACVISGLIVTLALAYVYLPVFHELQTTSCYAYLEMRFNRKIRSIASSLFLLYCLLNIPVVVYAPAIAFSQVSGINLHLITPVICCFCIFYTTIGGLRAVIWTDTLQFGAMILALVIVMILGTLQLGGIVNVFEIAQRGQRLIFFKMNPDPFVRTSFWMVTTGLTSMWISNVGVTPECIQRFMAIPKLSDAVKAAWIFGIGHIIVKLFSVYNGLLIFGKYETCDPIYTGQVQKYDQIFPFYVLDVARSIPGLPGLFVVGIFSAALSTMSTNLNTLSGTIYVDFIKIWFPNASEKTASSTMKILVIVIGTICLGLVFVVEKLQSIFSMAIALSGVTSGTLLGLFTMGMISPKMNVKGALWGAISSIIFVIFMATGAQMNVAQGNLRHATLPFRVDGCDSGINNVTSFIHHAHDKSYYIDGENSDNSSVFWLFRIGFMYYSLIGTVITMIVGYLVSSLTHDKNDVCDLKLITPILRKFYDNTKEIELTVTDESLELKKNIEK